MTIHIRSLSPRPSTVDAAARTVEAIVSTGADAPRAGFVERLDLAGADLSRLIGAPVLDAHRSASTRDQLGVIEAAELRPEGIWVRMKFRSNAAAASVLSDIEDGTLRGLSIGYQVAEWQETRSGNRRIRTAKRWAPIEVSVVPVPADPGAHFRNGENHMPEHEQQTTVEPRETGNPQTETRAQVNAQIRTIAETAGLTRAWADEQIDADASPDTARRAAFEAMQTRSAQTAKRLDWIRQLIGGARLADFEPRHLENLMDRKGGPSAANRLHKEMSEIFEYAQKKLGSTVPNPTGAIEQRKTRKGGFHTWTDAEVAKFRERHKSGTKARMALELMLATGAARQDACAMGRHNIKGGSIYYRRGKTGQETELRLEYMAELVAEIIQLPFGSSLFLTHSDGLPYTPESFGNWFAERCAMAGLPSECRAHGLRKRGATLLAEKGANELQIMAFLAHTSTKEALRYVQAARRKTLAEEGMRLAHVAQNVSNLSDWLGKTTTEASEKKGK